MLFFKYIPGLYQGADHTGRRVMNVGAGGGGGGHTTSTVNQSNIPDWLRPQVEAVLGAGMQEYFNTQFNPETGTYDITGVKPYNPFSEDARNYFAPINQQQQNVYDEAAGMGTSPLFGEAAGMTRDAGSAAMGSAADAMGFGQAGADYGASAAGLAPDAQAYGSRAAEIGEMGLNAETYGREIGDEARGFARQSAGMGDRYAQMATDPSSMQAYMSPYMQNVIETQKQTAIEDAQKSQLGANLGAARQGTYGGARQALMQGQRESALGKQLSDIQGRGLQDAFTQAQQAQQFGVTSGLQGLQGAQTGLGTALQGGQLGLSGIGQAISGQQAGLQGLGQAGQLYGQGMQGAGVGLQGVQGAQAGYGMSGAMGAQLGNIGTAEQDAILKRLGFQGQMGGEQRQFDQDIINQQIQNFALGEEMPFQRLAGYNALLRGYATPTTTTSQYQAQPSALQQLAGFGTTAAGIGTAAGMGKKEGGAIKLAKGGITDVDALEGMAEDLSIPQIQQSMQNETLPKYVGMPILEQKVNEAERMKMAQAMMGSEQQGQPQSISDVLMAKANQLQGAEPVMAAGGGIIAFQAGGLSLSDVMRQATPQEQRDYQRTGVLPARLQGMLKGETLPPKGSGKAGIEAVLAEAEAGRGPNVQRVSTDPETQNKQLAAAEKYRKDLMSVGNDYTKLGGITDIVPPPAAPAAAPPTAPPPPAEQKTDMATLLAEREAQQKAFIGEDPSIKKMRESLAKQGEDTLLNRMLRGSQMVFAGEQLRTRGDASGLEKVIAGEAKRAESAAEREARLAELEGADYRRKADIYKEVAGEERKKADTKAERAFQEKVLERKLQVEKEIAGMKPASASEYIGNLLRSKDRKEREVGKMLLGQSKTGAMTRKDAAEMVLKANPTLAFAGKEQELEDAINRIMSTLGGGSGGSFKVLGKE